MAPPPLRLQRHACPACKSEFSVKATIPHKDGSGRWFRVSVDYSLSDGTPVNTEWFAPVDPPSDGKPFWECDRCHERGPWTHAAVWAPRYDAGTGRSQDLFVEGGFDPLA